MHLVHHLVFCCILSQFLVHSLTHFCTSFEHKDGQELPYDSQYASSGTGLFADFSCSFDNPCTTSSCKSNPMVVKCIQGTINRVLPSETDNAKYTLLLMNYILHEITFLCVQLVSRITHFCIILFEFATTWFDY